MGGCMQGQNSRAKTSKQIMSKAHNYTLLSKEIAILKLIFEDLGERIEEHKVNLENFLLFFHKNGYWGQRLFKEFDCDETQLLSRQEFIAGMANIFKSSQTQKISLLYKFFSQNSRINDGVYFDQFLVMLYNYPKQDLKEILNQKQFFNTSVRNIIAKSQGKKKSSQFSLYHLNLPNKRDRAKIQQSEISQTPYPSMVCKEIRKDLEQNFKQNKQDTITRFNDGDNTIHLKTANIQALVRLYAKRIFKEERIDIKTGKLNFQQFRHWISVHKGLYENYYDGFHSLIWEIDDETCKPKYLSRNCEKSSEAKIIRAGKPVNCHLYFYHSVMVVCEEANRQQPILVICLEGLAVKIIYELSNGYGFSITHRDGFYKEKKIYVKNQAILLEWMQLLKFYNGESIQQKYFIGEKIGTGKFSVVYRCQSIADNKEYAIKEIASHKLDEESKVLIAHQSSIMKIISHPLLLQFKECIQTKTHIYIVTELVKGVDLFDFVKQNTYLDEYHAAKILQQLTVGMRYLHSLGIVHRDLKPENIMVVYNHATNEISYIKIIDFGFSNYLSRLVEKKPEELLAGTPNYIAPEILEMEGISLKIDNFSIGSILYFMLTGNLAFNDTSVANILMRTIKGQIRPIQRPGVSKECLNLIELLLKNNPDQRISLEDILKHPWLNILKQPKNVKTASASDKTITQIQ